MHHRFAVAVAQSEGVTALGAAYASLAKGADESLVVSTSSGDRLRMTAQDYQKSGDESPHSKSDPSTKW